MERRNSGKALQEPVGREAHRLEDGVPLVEGLLGFLSLRQVPYHDRVSHQSAPHVLQCGDRDLGPEGDASFAHAPRLVVGLPVLGGRAPQLTVGASAGRRLLRLEVRRGLEEDLLI
jgi:hypothetical protein